MNTRKLHHTIVPGNILFTASPTGVEIGVTTDEIYFAMDLSIELKHAFLDAGAKIIYNCDRDYIKDLHQAPYFKDGELAEITLAALYADCLQKAMLKYSFDIVAKIVVDAENSEEERKPETYE